VKKKRDGTKTLSGKFIPKNLPELEVG